MAAIAATAVMAVPPGAGAAQTFGADLSAPTNVSVGVPSPITVAQQIPLPAGSAPAGMTSPIDGVIVLWRIKVGAPTIPVALRLTRPGDSSVRTGVGTAISVIPPASATTEIPTRLAVQAGDALGLNFGPGTLTALTGGGQSLQWDPPLLDSEPPRPGNPFGGSGGVVILINADVEPDCDNDGLGDETQDANLSSCAPGTTPTGPAPTLPSGAPATCKGVPATILGTGGNDVRTASPGRDVIVALGGNDNVFALGANDVVCGGSGKDTLRGGKGKDTLLGQGGKDALKGGGGKDLCKGGNGTDTAKCEIEKSI